MRYTKIDKIDLDILRTVKQVLDLNFPFENDADIVTTIFKKLNNGAEEMSKSIEKKICDILSEEESRRTFNVTS